MKKSIFLKFDYKLVPFVHKLLIKYEEKYKCSYADLIIFFLVNIIVYYYWKIHYLKMLTLTDALLCFSYFAIILSIEIFKNLLIEIQQFAQILRVFVLKFLFIFTTIKIFGLSYQAKDFIFGAIVTNKALLNLCMNFVKSSGIIIFETSVFIIMLTLISCINTQQEVDKNEK